MTTNIDIINRALQAIGSQSQITSLTDGSPEASAAAVVYESAVQALLRMTYWEFARKDAPLVLTGFDAPPGWTFEYIYPVDCVELRAVLPNNPLNLYDPLPQRWAVGQSQGASEKAIWTNQVTAVAWYTFTASESLWDTIFIEAAVREVGSYLALAIAGRPDLAKILHEEAMEFVGLGEGRFY